MINQIDGAQAEHYQAYAIHCLRLAARTPDRGARIVLREMAAEWLRLRETSVRADRFDSCVMP